jgi:flavin-dependent dehydrogenase
MTEHAVLIAGGGQTGLMLGGELALAGVDVGIVEQRTRHDVIGSRAAGMTPRILEVLDQRGIAEALVSEKFFALCDVFGAANVGMLTGDASVGVTTTSSPGRHCADIVCGRSKVNAVMLRPKITSTGSALSRSLSA